MFDNSWLDLIAFVIKGIWAGCAVVVCVVVLAAVDTLWINWLRRSRRESSARSFKDDSHVSSDT